MLGCLHRVLEVPRVVDDTEVPRILWVKCATSAECKTIRIVVSMIKDSWVTAIGYVHLFTKPGECVWISGENDLGLVHRLDMMIKLDCFQLYLC